MAASPNPKNLPTSTAANQTARTWNLGRGIVFGRPQDTKDSDSTRPVQQGNTRRTTSAGVSASGTRRVSPPRLPNTALFPTQMLRRSLFSTGACSHDFAEQPNDDLGRDGNATIPDGYTPASSIHDKNRSTFQRNASPDGLTGSHEDLSDAASSTDSQAAYIPSQEAYFSSKETKGSEASNTNSFLNADEDTSQSPASEQSGTDPEFPVIALPFHIPSNVMQQALASQSTDSPIYWSHELYRDEAGHRPAVHYCRTLQASEQYARLFLEEPVLGFDLEWSVDHKIKRNIKHEVSVIQIASPTRILISHVAVMYGSKPEELLAPSIRKILESSDIIKTGVWIKGDCTKMRTHFGVDVCSMFELSHLHKLVTLSESAPHLVNRKLVPLKEVVQTHLQLPMAKGAVRVSAWDRTLDMEQIKYAAADAYAGVVIFHTLDAKRRAMLPCPPRPHMAESNLPIRLADGVSRSKLLEEGDDALDEEDETPEQNNSDVLTSGLTNDVAKLKLAEQRVDEVIGMETEANINGRDKRSKSLTPRKPTRTSTSVNSPKHSEVLGLVEASAWAEQHVNSRPAVSGGGTPSASNQRASASQLKAYHLWHYQELPASGVAATLRDPPIKTATAAGYIVQAVHWEELPFDGERLTLLAKDIGFMPWAIRESKLVGSYLKAGSKSLPNLGATKYDIPGT